MSAVTVCTDPNAGLTVTVETIVTESGEGLARTLTQDEVGTTTGTGVPFG